MDSSETYQYSKNYEDSGVIVWGLGTVGLTIARILKGNGRSVIGIDPKESRIQSALFHGVPATALYNSVNYPNQYLIHIVCVNTNPPLDQVEDEELARQYIYSNLTVVGHQIAQFIQPSSYYKRNAVILCSTVTPGVTELVLGKAIRDVTRYTSFDLYYHPQFFRDRYNFADLKEMQFRVIGVSHVPVMDKYSLFTSLYGNRDMETVVSIQDAELLKLVDNALHAMKISFANEVHKLCHAYGTVSDGVTFPVLQALKFIQANDRRTTNSYLNPGSPYGGKCLPKDMLTLIHEADKLGVEIPLIRSIENSNSLWRVENESSRNSGPISGPGQT